MDFCETFNFLPPEKWTPADLKKNNWWFSIDNQNFTRCILLAKKSNLMDIVVKLTLDFFLISFLLFRPRLFIVKFSSSLIYRGFQNEAFPCHDMPGGTVYVVNEAYGYYMFSIVKGVTVVVHWHSSTFRLLPRKKGFGFLQKVRSRSDPGLPDIFYCLSLPVPMVSARGWTGEYPWSRSYSISSYCCGSQLQS